MILDYYRRKTFVNAMVSGSGLNYRESDGVTVPHTDGTTIHMPPYNPKASPEQNRRWMYALIHECYHNTRENRDDFNIPRQKEIGQESTIGDCLNIVVDHNIERKAHGIMDGADQYVFDMFDHVGDRMVEVLPNMPPVIGALLALDLSVRSEWMGIADKKWRDYLSEEGKAKYDNMLQHRQEYAAPRAGGLPNYELTMKLLEAAGEDVDELKQEAKQAQQQQSGGSRSKGDQSPDGERAKGTGGTGEEDGQQDEGDGGNTPSPSDELSEGEKRRREEEARAKYKDLMPHSHDDEKYGRPDANMDITYDDDDWMDTGFIPEEVEVLPTNPEPAGGGKLLADTDFFLAKKVRNLLKVMSQSKYVGGKKRGKIKKKSIAGITAGREDIFRIKEQQKILDVAITVLVDGSGSMGGSRWDHASKAALMLNDCLNKLHVPTEVITFTTSGRTSSHVIMTTHNKSMPNHELANILAGYRDFGCNNDGESILWTHDRLIKQKQKRKILIVLSDGQPAGRQGIAGFTKSVVDEIERKSPVEIYGIGIETDSPKRIYSKVEIIQNCSQLEQALLNVLKQAMIGK